MKSPLHQLYSLRVLALLLVISLIGCVSGSPDKRTAQLLNQQGFGNRYEGDPEFENYLKINDRLTYKDTYNPDVGGMATVDIDGTIIVPEVGAVHVAGMTRTEVEAKLIQKLSPYYTQNDIQVTINSNPLSKIYYVLGEVGSPGKRTFKGDMTILDVVLSENINERGANMGRIKIIRADPRDPLVLPINISEMIDTGDSTANVLIKERDIVVVPPTMLAQVGYFISDLIYPVTTVLTQISSSLFAWNRAWGSGFYGGGFNNNQNQGFF